MIERAFCSADDDVLVGASTWDRRRRADKSPPARQSAFSPVYAAGRNVSSMADETVLGHPHHGLVCWMAMVDDHAHGDGVTSISVESLTSTLRRAEAIVESHSLVRACGVPIPVYHQSPVRYISDAQQAPAPAEMHRQPTGRAGVCPARMQRRHREARLVPGASSRNCPAAADDHRHHRSTALRTRTHDRSLRRGSTGGPIQPHRELDSRENGSRQRCRRERSCGAFCQRPFTSPGGLVSVPL